MTAYPTEVRTWTREDRSLRAGLPLPEGPWLEEPDKVQWVDQNTGLDCLIVRGPGGALCGYVGVPPEHPWHGKGYSACLIDNADCEDRYSCDHGTPEALVEVHGGITFASDCQESDTVNQDRLICHVPFEGRTPHVWWFGFDCAHSFDLTPLDLAFAIKENFRYPFIDPRARDGVEGETYRDVEYVKDECKDLALQLANPDSLTKRY